LVRERHVRDPSEREEFTTGFGDDVSFERRLAETVAWCQPRARASDPAASLRSVSLRPRVLEIDRPSIVRSVTEARAQSLLVRNGRGDRKNSGLAGGRLLAYFPDDDLSDGAAEAETNGFFDVHNTPPWDTWVALFRDEGRDLARDCLVSWVPRELLKSVDRGIYVNPEECIVWLGPPKLPIVEQIRASRPW
jgi:hypothetical protein